MPYKFSLLLMFFVLGAGYYASAQRNYDLHFIAFKDKTNSDYSLFKPQAYLSEKALMRRAKQQILIDSTDLPVNINYINLIEKEGLTIHNVSRWLNGVLVVGELSAVEAIAKKHADFVVSVEAIGFVRKANYATPTNNRYKEDNYKKTNDYYGGGSNQIKMLNGHYLHSLGWKGNAVDIAIFDAGFPDLRETPALYSAIDEKRILGTYDLVENDTFVYDSDSHGRNVLSTIASDIPYVFVGTAPKANYYLMRTEDAQAELIAEEYYWLLAAELADSLGVDVINSSLGYASFDDKKMNHAYVDLDGNTTVISKAAKYASEKGILVVTSAGNEGSNKWKHITAPADVPTVLTVGAVDREGIYAKFSSQGLPQQSYIKPDVTARGMNSVIAATFAYDTRYASGTSFSSPIVAGMTAALWQALPQFSAQDIIYHLRLNASQTNKPDYMLGYGIPDYYQIYKKYSTRLLEIDYTKAGDYLLDKPFRVEDKLELVFENIQALSNLEVRLIDDIGRIIDQQILTALDKQILTYVYADWSKLSKGIYCLEVIYKGEIKRLKIIY